MWNYCVYMNYPLMRTWLYIQCQSTISICHMLNVCMAFAGNAEAYKPITFHHVKLFTCNQLMEHHVLRLHQSADEKLCYSLIPQDTGNHWTETASMWLGLLTGRRGEEVLGTNALHGRWWCWKENYSNEGGEAIREGHAAPHSLTTTGQHNNTTMVGTPNTPFVSPSSSLRQPSPGVTSMVHPSKSA